jgi:predicted lipoprotein with Yx(FWY)xxD motif
VHVLSVRRLAPPILAVALLALALTSIAAGAASSSPVKTRRDASLGTILVAKNGHTLYHRKGETTHSFKCTGSCRSLWPPLTVGSKDAIKNAGVKHLGVVRRPDTHKLQVTYKGQPLYRFANDRHSGDTKGQGFGNVWFAIVTKKPAPASSAPPPSSGYTPPSSSPGYTYPGYPAY